MTLWNQSLQHPLRYEAQSWLRFGTCAWCRCQQVKCKGERDLSQVAYVEAYDTLMNAAKCRNDETMMMRIRGEDLIAINLFYTLLIKL